MTVAACISEAILCLEQSNMYYKQMTALSPQSAVSKGLSRLVSC